MNQESRDEQVRALFHELGEEHERLTPGFAGVLEAALRRRRRSRRLLVWRVAAAVAVPALSIVVGLALLGNQSTETLSGIDPTIVERLPFVKVTPNKALTPKPLPLSHFRRQQPYRKAVSRTHLQSVQISQWQSPTDFLLETPGSEILRKLPRIPDSPPGMPRSIPDYHN
jgi:hypothetical protein